MKNLPTLTQDGGEKPEMIKQERNLRLLCLFGGGGGDKLSKLTTFLYWSHREPCYW